MKSIVNGINKKMVKQPIVYKVNDGEKYGIKFGKSYSYELIKLINDKLKSEGKSIIKIAFSVDDFEYYKRKYNLSEKKGGK